MQRKSTGGEETAAQAVWPSASASDCTVLFCFSHKRWTRDRMEAGGQGEGENRKYFVPFPPCLGDPNFHQTGLFWLWLLPGDLLPQLWFSVSSQPPQPLGGSYFLMLPISGLSHHPHWASQLSHHPCNKVLEAFLVCRNPQWFSWPRWTQTDGMTLCSFSPTMACALVPAATGTGAVFLSAPGMTNRTEQQALSGTRQGL